jgi:hypothetical protein
MKKLSETLTELGITFSFPIEIKDFKGNEIYYENSNDCRYKYDRDFKGNEIYYENSTGVQEGTSR